MKRFSFIAVAVVFSALFALSANAQTAPTKIGLVNTATFSHEKEGITKVRNAITALNNELRPKEQELTALQTKIRGLENELRTMQNSNPNVPINQSTFNAKRDEGASLTRELEFKQKEYEAFRAKREEAILGPVNEDISSALSDYAKQKGYVMVFDAIRLIQAGVLLNADASTDITKDFITFYNSRPAGAATASNPR
jgi:Skp family chaperone for outer membrane proteins